MKNAKVHFDRVLVQRYDQYTNFHNFGIPKRDTLPVLFSKTNSSYSIYRQTFFNLEELRQEREKFVRNFQQLVLACEYSTVPRKNKGGREGIPHTFPFPFVICLKLY